MPKLLHVMVAAKVRVLYSHKDAYVSMLSVIDLSC